MSTSQEKRITIGILAHVDAGKTTLSEAILYKCGAIRKPGRVDHGDALLDSDSQEKERGITIFAGQAVFTLPQEDPPMREMARAMVLAPEQMNPTLRSVSRSWTRRGMWISARRWSGR